MTSYINKNISRGLLAGAAIVLSVSGIGSVASASHMPDTVYTYEAQLDQLNNSGTFGHVYVTATGTKASVYIKTTGSSAGLPHAQHIHLGPGDGKIGTCPTLAVDTNGDGIISTPEAAGNYGPIGVSLTTTGDTSPASALAVARFPVGMNDGSFTYERTVDLPEGVTAADLGNTEIVQHGISKLFDDPTKYDGSAVSPLAANLPLEATVPANCGGLRMTGQFTPATAALTNNATMLNNRLLANADQAKMDVPTASSAISVYTQAINDAANQYQATVSSAATMSTNTNQYVDALNNAKTTYLNKIEVARNDLVAQLSNMGHDANVAKDMLVNMFNQQRDYFTNQAEVIKNT